MMIFQKPLTDDLKFPMMQQLETKIEDQVLIEKQNIPLLAFIFSAITKIAL